MTNSMHRLEADGPDIQPIETTSTLEHSLFGMESVSFKSPVLEEKLGGMALNQLSLLPPDFSGVTTGEGHPTAALRHVADLELGRERSRAEVQFGQLFVTNEGQTPTTESVAVKHVSVEKAVRELMAERFINSQLGRRAAFQTLGFVKRDDDKVGIISRYEHQVVSLDNTLYEPSSSYAERESAVRLAAAHLAELHGKKLGIIHGDAQPKNIAVNSAKQSWFSDLETARDLRTNSNGQIVKDPEINKLMDIGDFFGLNKDGFDWKPTPGEAMTFIETYLDQQSSKYPLDEVDIMDLVEAKVMDN